MKKHYNSYKHIITDMLTDNFTFKYLPSSERDIDWGLSVSCVGSQQVASGDDYPPQHHPANYSFLPSRGRILDEYQIIYITKGKGTFTSEHGGEHTVEAGDMLLLFPGERHSYRPDQTTGWNEYWIGFCGPNIDTRVNHGFFSVEKPIAHVGISEDIVHTYSMAINAVQQMAPGYQQMLAGCVNMLLGFIYSAAREANDDMENITKAMHKAAVFIHENFCKDIHPEDVAAEVNFGYSRFRKAFTDHTGISPYQYILKLRIQRSKELLQHTHKTMSEIAYEAGFNNPLYFSTAFKRETGMSPKAYREATVKE